MDKGKSIAKVLFLQDKVVYTCELSCIQNRTELRPGDIRMVKWQDGHYYKAVIKHIGTDRTVTVKFSSDNVVLTTNILHVKMWNSLQVGDIRQVKWTDGHYYKARIISFPAEQSQFTTTTTQMMPSTTKTTAAGMVTMTPALRTTTINPTTTIATSMTPTTAETMAPTTQTPTITETVAATTLTPTTTETVVATTLTPTTTETVAATTQTPTITETVAATTLTPTTTETVVATTQTPTITETVVATTLTPTTTETVAATTQTPTITETMATTVKKTTMTPTTTIATSMTRTTTETMATTPLTPTTTETMTKTTLTTKIVSTTMTPTTTTMATSMTRTTTKTMATTTPMPTATKMASTMTTAATTTAETTTIAVAKKMAKTTVMTTTKITTSMPPTTPTKTTTATMVTTSMTTNIMTPTKTMTSKTNQSIPLSLVPYSDSSCDEDTFQSFPLSPVADEHYSACNSSLFSIDADINPDCTTYYSTIKQSLDVLNDDYINSEQNKAFQERKALSKSIKEVQSYTNKNTESNVNDSVNVKNQLKSCVHQPVPESTCNKEMLFNSFSIDQVHDNNSSSSSSWIDSDADPEYQKESSSPESSNYSDDEEISSKHTEVSEIENISYETSTTKAKGNTLGSSRQKDFCFYCEDWVSTFSRHIIRNHSLEIEVQKIASKPMKSFERKELISQLRKKGNFLTSDTRNIRRVRKVAHDRPSTNPKPCKFCLGLYSKKHLWRHQKKCYQKTGEGSSTALSLAQNLLSKDFKTNQFLREKVFDRMRSDEIAVAAQKDVLICAYGSRYLLTHRKSHQFTVCSRKMRELGRLLIRVKELDPKIKNLIHALRPENFDLLVNAARLESGHDTETDMYKAPTYGMNVCTSLKECCEIGITHALKRKYTVEGKTASELEAELRTTILLIQSNWNVEISHQASNCLSANKMNRVTIVPLASDLKLFRDFLIEQGNSAAASLTANENDVAAFKTLVETVYCRVLLLCRKRPGELQRLLLETYEKVCNRSSYEEFKDVVKPSEMILIRKFKRVVIEGKRKVTPVLFSQDVQEHISLLIKVRKHFVKDCNPYLFANTTSGNPIVGYKVLTAQANKAGVKRPDSIRSRLLRKHLATISQLFDMTDQDIEQLSSFMGHTSGIHRSEYRLPDDLFQTSKIAKLLLAMESGEGSKFKGKSLDEIEINLDENLLEDHPESPSDDSDNEEFSQDDQIMVDYAEASTSSNQSTKITTPTNLSKLQHPKKRKRELVKWKDEEKKVVAEFFKQHIRHSKPPKKNECEQLIETHKELLGNKSWLKIKVFVQNLYSKKTKFNFN